MREQSPKQLYVVRGKMYELLVNCIPPELIFRRLATELLRKLDDELRHKVPFCITTARSKFPKWLTTAMLCASELMPPPDSDLQHEVCPGAFLRCDACTHELLQHRMCVINLNG